MEAKIRKHQDILRCSGYAVILFGAWSIIRMVMLRIIDPLELDSLLAVADAESDMDLETIAFVSLLVLLALDLLFRLYVGRSAIKEGRGGEKRLFYVLLAGGYAAVSVWSDLFYLVDCLFGDSSIWMLGPVIVDISTCGALIEIVISSLCLRKLRRGGEV